jgi:hypothetical protein
MSGSFASSVLLRYGLIGKVTGVTVEDEEIAVRRSELRFS